MLKKLRASSLSKIWGVVVSLIFVGAVLTEIRSIDHHSIGSPSYVTISMHSRVLAEALSPATEPLLVAISASRAVANPETARDELAKVTSLRAEYDARVKEWLAMGLDATVHDGLANAVVPAATKVFDAAVRDVFPRLQAGDVAHALAGADGLRKLLQAYHAETGRLADVVRKAVHETEAEVRQSVHTIDLITLFVMSIGLILLVGGLAAFQLLFLKPLDDLLRVMQQVAMGDVNVACPHIFRNDEVGDIAMAVEIFRINTEQSSTLIDEVKSARVASESRQAELRDMALGFLRRADALKAVFERQAHVVKSCARSLDSSAAATEGQAGQGVASAADAAANVQTVASATEQLSMSTKRVTEQTIGAMKRTAEASRKAALANDDIKKLTDSAGQIRHILESIGSIATQTNLLSLNATIEAARAGEAGRGFAVVAGEVKALAAQTAKATEEVAQLVGHIDASTLAAVSSISAISQEIDEVTKLNSEIASAVGEQDKATQEIAESAIRAAHATEGASTTSTQVSDLARVTRSEVGTIETAAVSLFSAIDDFSHGMDSFLGSIDKDMKNRRANIRHRVDHDIQVLVHGSAYPSRLVDISLAGACVTLPREFSAGETLEINFGAKTCRAEVVWCAEGRAGVKFVTAMEEFPVSLADSGYDERIAA